MIRNEPTNKETTKTTYIIVLYKQMSCGLEAYGLSRSTFGRQRRVKWETYAGMPGHEFDTLAEARKVFARLDHVRKGRRAAIMEHVKLARETFAVAHSRGDVVERIATLAVGANQA